MLSVIDTDTHSDTNDIICYMIVFWDLNSYWCNFKTFLHGEWNEKIWIVCHVWNCETVWTVCYVKNLHKLFMCEWNDEIWIIIVYVWTNLNNLNILNRLNRFLNKFSVWTGWIDFFVKFLWNLNRFYCCFFLSRLNRFCVNQGCQNRDLM